jgi:hypothetical protein
LHNEKANQFAFDEKFSKAIEYQNNDNINFRIYGATKTMYVSVATMLDDLLM